MAKRQAEPEAKVDPLAGQPGWQPVPGVTLRLTLRGHSDWIGRIAWSPDGKWLASPSADQTIRIWDAVTGEVVRTLEGHTNRVLIVAWSPDGRRFASAANDKTVRLWDAETGLATNVLEGHTGEVRCAAFAPDARLIASKVGSGDSTVRLWRCDTWQPVAVIPEPASLYWPPGMAFHPHEQVLATVGSDPGTEKGQADQLIHIWQLDYNVLLDRRSGFQPDISGEDRQAGSLTHEDSVKGTTAKIVLVGDSGVGKTGLGWRLAHGAFKEHASTHGQQFWVLDQLGAQRQDGTRCEAVLWDLAGQPDY